MSSPAHEERFLVLAPTGRDGALTRELLESSGLHALVCSDMACLCDEARRGAAALLIAEEVLRPSNLEQLTRLVTDQPAWSDLPIVIFTGRGATIEARVPAARLLASLGNVMLLDRPLPPITVLSTVRSALRARRRQYQAREELARQQEAVRARDQFLAMLGHELRNPLGVILLAADVLERGGEPGRQSEIIQRQGRNLGRLVDDLLDVSRVTSGKILLKKEPLRFAGVVESSVSSCRQDLRGQELRVTIGPGAEDAVVEGDLVRLQQVVVNLVTNAIKYTDVDGTVDVVVGVESDHVVLRIVDDGPGISDEMLGRVFDLFTQADNTLVRARGGLGIGLTLVQSLVTLHGGEVEARSEGPGQGSEFIVRLPLHPDAVALDPAPEEVESSRVRRILVVEDNADARDLLQQLLQSFGHRVDVTAEGWEAVRQALTLSPDVLIVDVGLPGLDGYEVARRVRDALGDEVLLVALTGYGQPEDRQRAREAGFDVHLTKPVDATRLQRLLA